MRKTLILLVVLFIFPSLLHAESSYFLACQEGKIIDVIYEQKSKNFKRGDLFEVPIQAFRKENDSIINDDNRGACWSHSGNPTCPLVVSYGREVYGRLDFGNQGGYLQGFVDLGLGCWFKSESPIPIKGKITNQLFNIFSGIVNSTREEYYEKTLDKEFVDIMCSEHPTQFNVAGKTFTDIKKEKSEEHVKKIVENDRLLKLDFDESIRQDKAREEKARQAEQEKVRIQQDKEDRLRAELKKYNVQFMVSGQDLLANPFRYKENIVATSLVFIRMMEESVGVFSVEKPGYPTEDIVVSNLPANLFGDNSLFPLPTFLVVKVKGTTEVTNRMGARLTIPHLEYIAKVISDWR